MDSLNKLGSEFKIIHMGQKRVICSTSVELSQDNLVVLQAAEENKGWITASNMRMKNPAFNRERFLRAVDQLVKEGLAWIDDQPLLN